MKRFWKLCPWWVPLVLYGGVSVKADEAKPLGYVSVVQDVLEIPGLNAQAGVYYDALASGEFALGASAAIARAFNKVDIRLGYVRHESKVWGGKENWESVLVGLSSSFKDLGLQPKQALGEASLGAWLGKDTDRNLWRGGVNAVWGL